MDLPKFDLKTLSECPTKIVIVDNTGVNESSVLDEILSIIKVNPEKVVSFTGEDEVKCNQGSNMNFFQTVDNAAKKLKNRGESAVILNNAATAKGSFGHNIIKNMYMNARTWGMYFIHRVQPNVAIPPVIRANINYTFIYLYKNDPNIETAHRQYFSDTKVTLEMFKTYLEKYPVLVVDSHLKNQTNVFFLEMPSTEPSVEPLTEPATEPATEPTTTA